MKFDVRSKVLTQQIPPAMPTDAPFEALKDKATNSASENNQVPEIPTLPEFFAVVAPGFEMLAANELISWLPEAEIEVHHGGISFHAPLVEGCELNRKLKIPNRILLRLTSFTCRDFPKLFKKTSLFPWEQWIPNGAEAVFNASSQASRVNIKKRIEETCVEGFKKRTKNRVAKPTRALEVMIRINEDYCTVSIDTSGEILHKRGTRTLSSDAPIRETIAAALLFWMIARNEDANAGARFVKQEARSVTLVDPMMGAGTFFLEAAHLNEKVEGRDFAYEQFPRYQRERDAAIAKEVDATLVAGGSAEVPPEALVKHDSRLKNPFSNFVGLDVDAKAVRTTEGNLKPLIGQQQIEALQGDIFKIEPLAKKSAQANWILANPPYGERLRIEGPLKDYYEALFAACERFAEPERACFIIPETAKPTSLKAPREWKLDDSLKFQNGGIPVVALQFVRK